MAKSQKRYLVLLVFGLLVIIAAGVWMVFGRKTQIYEKTEEIFGNPLMGYAPCAWEETIGEDISLLYMDITWAELEPCTTCHSCPEGKVRLRTGQKDVKTR